MVVDSRIICQLCGKPGHVSIKCFKHFDVHFTGLTPSPQAFITDANPTDYSQEEAYYEQQCDPTWYVDSGATNHITHDLHNLNISIPYNGTDQVAVGNGQQLPIQSVGKSALLSNSSSIVSSNSSLM